MATDLVTREMVKWRNRENAKKSINFYRLKVDFQTNSVLTECVLCDKTQLTSQ